jgi:hypothetical protein
MRAIRRVGVYADIVEAPSPEDHRNTVTLGIKDRDISRVCKTRFSLGDCAVFRSNLLIGIWLYAT